MGGENTPLLSPWEPEVCLWDEVMGQLKRNSGEGAVRENMTGHVSPLGRVPCLTLVLRVCLYVPRRESVHGACVGRGLLVGI